MTSWLVILTSSLAVFITFTNAEDVYNSSSSSIGQPERSACGVSSRIDRTSRIVGGDDAEYGQFPWQAYVRVGRSRCGGALVGFRHVVTAAHCVARAKSDITVILGDYMLNSEIEEYPSARFKVSDVRIHPNFRFTPQADRYDVAVLILDRRVRYRPNIRPICLPPKDRNYLGATGYAAGWGALSPGTKVRPNTLQVVDVPIITNKDCEVWHKRKSITVKLHPEMMCAGFERGGKDSCQGDSGGPLMVLDRGYWYLVGIVSAGYSCAKEYQPGIYHRVPQTSDWISANIYN
ncbi:Serine proteinase stubble [Nymphon striatum]|nr:Serine proteinase stubble [Nymphon striatum]